MMLFKALITAAVALLSYIAYFVLDLIGKRKRLLATGLPMPPNYSLLFGHLALAAECRELFPVSIHSHVWADYIRVRYNLPEMFYIDWRPFGPLWLHIADPEIASEFIVGKQNLPKSPLETGYLNRFLGDNNMVSLEGDRWKRIRGMFNPGFSAANVMSNVGGIVAAGVEFVEVLKEKAQSRELFEMEEYATRLTIDIIGKVVLDVDLGCQGKVHDIAKYFRERAAIMPGADAIFPWQDVDLLRPFKLWWNGRKMDAAIGVELDKKIHRRALGENEGGPKSIVDLALNAYEKEMGIKRILTPGDMPASLRRDLVDQLKTFVFAGHDTTSSTLAWAYYLIHRHPEVFLKIKAELDNHFPPGTDTATAIRKDPYILNKLEYTTAAIKETLRVFPPASTLRTLPQDTNSVHTTITNPTTGEIFFLEGTHIWPQPHLINRNKRFFPQPTHFIPSRFLTHLTPFPAPKSQLHTPAGKNAFQPFLIGPRNCIGQELAMIEARIILALTVREFDFVLEYPGEEPDPQPRIPESTAEEFWEDTEEAKWCREGRGRRKVVEGHRVFQKLVGSAKPVGGCPGRIYIRES